MNLFLDSEKVFSLFSKKWLQALLLFLVIFLLFFWFHSTPYFADPDSFYHIKIALLIKEKGIVKDFPWLQFTILKDYFTDHHFLYHLFLIPFISFSPLWGAKLSSVFLAAVLGLVFFYFFSYFKIRGAFFYVLFLFTVGPFLFRMGLVKVPSLSLIFLFLIIFSIFKEKKILLIILSFFYVWLYAGWPIILFVLFFHFFSTALFDCFEKKEKLFKNFLISLFSFNHLSSFLACFLGLSLGLILNPYFPENLYFYWVQIFKIAIINYRGIVNVGREWYPYQFLELLGQTSLLFILLLFALGLFILNLFSLQRIPLDLKRKSNLFTLFLLFLLFFLFTLKSKRYVEYFVPLGVVFSAFLINESLGQVKILRKFFRESFKRKRKIVFISLVIFFLLSSSFIVGQDLLETKRALQNGFHFKKYQKVSEWFKENIPQGEIIFHGSWDDFPMLFYYNEKNYYLVGLDPVFMYEKDKDLYREWFRIVSGRDKENLAFKIRKDFHSSYILVSNQEVFRKNLSVDPSFEKIYQDGEVTVFKIKSL